jgi:hypothetical protein
LNRIAHPIQLECVFCLWLWWIKVGLWRSLNLPAHPVQTELYFLSWLHSPSSNFCLSRKVWIELPILSNRNVESGFGFGESK